MKNIFTTVLFLSLLAAGNAHAAFQDAYDISNWTQTVNGGSVDTGGNPYYVILTSSDLENGATNQDLTIAANASGNVSFAWDYTTADTDGPMWDQFGYLLNDVFTQLTVDSGLATQSGFVTFAVTAGDIFGFRAGSFDSAFGAATTMISEFNAPQVPVPAALWLMLAPVMGLLGKKRKAGA